jgi:serine/threonine-protein kinase
MGTVFLAQRDDELYERLVAIKILRTGLEETEHRHRFLAERQILARLEHPNIARLYGGGSTEDGRPYLVMELIEGLPVDEYCDRHRLTVDQRLALFLRICSAVHYAHQNLLVHRDIKPANILVTAKGEPALLDFGIAKQLAPEAADPRTRSGLLVMTPSYASPEQMRGEAITTASDVYSLGVLLYELLAGRSPYQAEEGAPPYQLELAIHEQQPEKPSAALARPGKPSPEEIAAARGSRRAALRRRLAGDLDTIVLAALRKEPARRYESVAGLAADLERHLHDLPVFARRDTLLYRARKLVRRHRAAAAAAAAVVLLVAALVAGLFAQARQTARERDKARSALSFLVDTFQQADPYKTRGNTLTAREILDRGAERISRRGLGGEPGVRAVVMDAIGEVDLGLGRYDAAAPLLERSLAIRRRVFGPNSPEAAESLERLAELRTQRSDLPGAESALRQALAIRRRRTGGGDLALVKTLNQLATTLVAKGVSPAEAPEIEALHREALARARRVEGPAGLTVAETLLHLADLRRAQGSYADAESLFLQGLAVERKALGDRDPRLWRDRSRLGDTLFEAGKFKEAEEVLRRSLAMQRQLLGSEHPDVAHTLSSLAAALQLQGKYPEVETLEREVLALARTHYGPTHSEVTEALCNLAASLVGQKRLIEAVPLYEEALEIRRRTLGEQHWQVAQILLLLAEVHRSNKSYPKALALARQAYDIFAAGEGPEHPYTSHALREIGKNYLEQNRFAAAEPFLRRCLEIRQKKLEAGHPELAKAQYSLAKCLIGQGRFDEASALLRAALATFTTVYGPSSEIYRMTAELLQTAVRGKAVTSSSR